MKSKNTDHLELFSADFDFEDRYNSLGDIDRQEIGEQEKQIKIERYKDDSRIRKSLSLWVRWVISLWLLSITVLLWLQSFGVTYLDTTIVVTLLGTTTLNILGLAFILLKGMFLSRRSGV